MPESSTSNSNPDLYAEFRTRSGRHVRTVERYGCPFDNSENVSFVECFSCEAVTNSLEEVKRSQSQGSDDKRVQFISRKQDLGTL